MKKEKEKTVTIKLSEEVHTKLKVYAAEKKEGLQPIADRAILKEIKTGK